VSAASERAGRAGRSRALHQSGEACVFAEARAIHGSKGSRAAIKAGPTALAILLACGDHRDDAPPARGTGGTSYASQTGGVTAYGGTASAGTEGSATGAGGPVNHAGSGGTGNLVERVRAYCSAKQANGFVLGCMAVFTQTYVADCQTTLTELARTCRAEVDALVLCGSYRPVLDYRCDASGDVTFDQGICAAESGSLNQCLG
jgi:hypothetical protein